MKACSVMREESNSSIKKWSIRVQVENFRFFGQRSISVEIYYFSHMKMHNTILSISIIESALNHFLKMFPIGNCSPSDCVRFSNEKCIASKAIAVTVVVINNVHLTHCHSDNLQRKTDSNLIEGTRRKNSDRKNMR